jgi:membrane associated rhomboid family serine protease
MQLCCLVYRTNTFPLVHAGFFHALMNVLALTPLLERFEAEHGTLTTFLLFVGRKCISLYGHVLYYTGKGLTNDTSCSALHDPGIIVYVD